MNEEEIEKEMMDGSCETLMKLFHLYQTDDARLKN